MQSGVHIFGNSFSDDMLHLSPVDGQIEVAIDAVVPCQEFELSLRGRGMRLVGTLKAMASTVEVLCHQLVGIGGHRTSSGGLQTASGKQICPSW